LENKRGDDLAPEAADLLDEKIKEVEQKHVQIKHRLSEENKNNEYELQMNIGKKVNYGQKIQLKHIFSGQYLTLNTKRISQEHGCVQLKLSSANEHS